MPFDAEGHYIPICKICNQPILQHTPMVRITTDTGTLEGDVIQTTVINGYNYHTTCYLGIKPYILGDRKE